MTTDELERELADDLKDDARENINLSEGTDEEKRDKSMENIAHSIAKAIKNGEVSLKKAAPAELNALENKDELVLWLVDGNGVLDGEPTLVVTDKDIVRWDATKWTLFSKGGSSPSPTPTIDAYTRAETDARIATAVGNETYRAQTVEASLALAIRNSRVDVSGKADKVAGATNGHLAGLDSTGNLTDSGYAPGDFVTSQALADEATARENADTALQGNIDAEETAREDADATLQSNIESEATEREQADGELQAQIDAISSRSDVVDVVASYAELVAYDTSTIADNDVIKVIADETHEDAIAYYRWSTTTEAWSFIGSQGPYYTITETDALLEGKVDKVTGKGLSTNDYTTAEKNKLAGIAEGADKSPVKFFNYTADYADIAAAIPYANPAYNVFLTGKEDGTYPRMYSLVKFDRTSEEMVFAAMRNDSTLCTITKTRSYGTAWSYHNYTLAPQSHASSDTTYGKGTSSNYGHVKLSDSTSSTSGVSDGVAATPSAVKAAYDLADAKANADGSNASGTWEAMSRGVSGKYLDIRSRVVKLGTLTSSGQSVSFSLLISIQTNAGYPRKALYLASVSWRLNQDRANLSLVCLSTTPSNFSKTTWGKCTLVIGDGASGAGLYLEIETLVSNLKMTCAMLHTVNSEGFSVELQNITSQISNVMFADEVGVAFVPYNTAVGSVSRPVYSNTAGELKPCDLIINKGSHSTVTLDFSGTLGSDADAIYFV